MPSRTSVDTLEPRSCSLLPATRRRANVVLCLGQVVELNMRVADAVATRYRSRGIALDDLRQVAYLALVKAADRFDSDRSEAEFLSYAVPTIRGELRKHFRDHGWMVRPTRRIQELQTTINKATEQLAATLGHSPRPSDLAQRLDVSEDDIVEALSAEGCFTPYSLDHPLPSGTSVGDTAGDEDPGHIAAEARVIVAPLLEGLEQRDRHVVSRRFYDGWTQREIGNELGVTQMQVSRILTRILTTMRARVGELRPPSSAV